MSRPATSCVKVVKAGDGRYSAIHAATEQSDLACGTRSRDHAPVTETSTDLNETTSRLCRAQLGLDRDTDTNVRLEALFVLSITLSLRPGVLGRLTWDHVDPANGVIHVRRSASRTGDTKTPQSRRLLVLPKRAVEALTKYKKQAITLRCRISLAWSCDARGLDQVARSALRDGEELPRTPTLSAQREMEEAMPVSEFALRRDETKAGGSRPPFPQHRPRAEVGSAHPSGESLAPPCAGVMARPEEQLIQSPEEQS